MVDPSPPVIEPGIWSGFLSVAANTDGLTLTNQTERADGTSSASNIQSVIVTR